MMVNTKMAGTGAESALIELWGAPGVIILGLVTAVVILFRANQQLNQQILSRYESMLETVLKQQHDVQNTLDRLVDGIATEQYIKQLLEDNRRNN